MGRGAVVLSHLERTSGSTQVGIATSTSLGGTHVPGKGLRALLGCSRALARWKESGKVQYPGRGMGAGGAQGQVLLLLWGQEECRFRVSRPGMWLASSQGHGESRARLQQPDCARPWVVRP